MCDQCVFSSKYFLSSILFWANWREFPWDAIICVWKGSDSLWLMSHSDRNQCYNQLSSRYWSVLKSLSAEYDLVVPEKMSCYQILPCALQAILNSHPFGSRHQKRMEHMLCCEHMALWKTVAVVLLCPTTTPLASLSHPWTNLTPLFLQKPAKTLPRSCTTCWIGAEETLRVTWCTPCTVGNVRTDMTNTKKEDRTVWKSIFIVNVEYKKKLYGTPH